MTEATTLLQALAGGLSRPATKCKLGRILDQVDDETRTALNVALTGEAGPPFWSSRQIARLVTEHVERVSRDVVTTHRNGTCGCGR